MLHLLMSLHRSNVVKIRVFSFILKFDQKIVVEMLWDIIPEYIIIPRLPNAEGGVSLNLSSSSNTPCSTKQQ